MRYSILAVALVAASATAQVQPSPWSYFQDEVQTKGLLMAFVEAADGTQFILKCDKSGKRSVYAMVTSPKKLGRPGPIPASRTVTYRFDGGPPEDGAWRYYEQYAVALHTTRDRALVKLLERFGDAKQMELRLEPLNGAPITVLFEIAGAQDAIARVFESCEDENPVG